MKKLIIILLLLPVLCSSQVLIENVKEIVFFDSEKNTRQKFNPNNNISFIQTKEYFLITNATKEGDVKYKIVEELEVHKQEYDTSHMKMYSIIVNDKKCLLIIFNYKKGVEIGIISYEENNKNTISYI